MLQKGPQGSSNEICPWGHSWWKPATASRRTPAPSSLSSRVMHFCLPWPRGPFFNHCLDCCFVLQVCTMHGCRQLVHCDILVQHCPPLHLDKFNELLPLFKLMLQYVYFNIHPRIRFFTFSSKCSWDSGFGTHRVHFFTGPSWLNMILVMVANDVL